MSMGSPAESQASDARVIAESLVDRERFTFIVNRHFREIRRYLVIRLGEDGEDLASETFAVAFRRRSSYDPEKADARPWLYGIATNLLHHHRRSEHRQLDAYTRVASESSVEGEPDESERVVDQLDAESAAADVLWAFSQLAPDQRDVLYLVGVAGLSYEHAAQALGLKLGTLHSRAARARKALEALSRTRQRKLRPSARTAEKG
jgi:RNA polymerase sigma factor (sigma-70 family)